MTVAIFSTKYYEREYMDRSNQNAFSITYFDMPLNASTVSFAKGFDAVSIQLNDSLDEGTIIHLAKSGVKLIALRSAGYDNVDLAAAEQNNIAVVRVPSYSPQAIAEYAVALILTLNRKTHKAYNRVRENNFELQGLLGFNLSGKTVGVIGTGKIGSAFCRIMLGFGCKVLAFDIKPNPALQSQGLFYHTLDTILRESDIISIHCPLHESSRHLFNAGAFEKMKNGAMLINTGRGAIIETSAAIQALKDGKLGYLGIDVYEGEENFFSKDLSDSMVGDDLLERLMSFNNVLITPHQAFFTQEALAEISRITIQNLTDFQKGVVGANQVMAHEIG